MSVLEADVERRESSSLSLGTKIFDIIKLLIYNIYMVLIEDYITQSKESRQTHLDLSSPCIERGGPVNGGLSSYCKGLMAHLLDTSIPSGHKIHICHACNNGKCSNPKHLYWGTAQENRLDQGSETIWDRMVAKYGYKEACKRNSRKGNTFGSGNKGKAKSAEHSAKIATSVKAKHEAGNYYTNKPGRKVRVTE